MQSFVAGVLCLAFWSLFWTGLFETDPFLQVNPYAVQAEE